MMLAKHRVILSRCNSPCRCLVNNGLPWNLVGLQILVVLQGVELFGKTVEWRALVLRKARIILCLSLEGAKHAAKVEPREDSVVWDPVVSLSWLPIVQMLEAGHVR